MDEYNKYVISVGQEVVARDVPEHYVPLITRAILNEYHHRDPNISVTIGRQ